MGWKSLSYRWWGLEWGLTLKSRSSTSRPAHRDKIFSPLLSQFELPLADGTIIILKAEWLLTHAIFRTYFGPISDKEKVMSVMCISFKFETFHVGYTVCCFWVGRLHSGTLKHRVLSYFICYCFTKSITYHPCTVVLMGHLLTLKVIVLRWLMF